MKIAVMGAGHGGVAAAADLSLAGHEVRLFQSPLFADVFRLIRESRQIKISGVARQGMAQLAAATHAPEEALAGAEVVLVIVPSFAQEAMARLCGPFLRDGQYVFLTPGGFGSYLFAKTLREMGLNKELVFGETSTLPYGARLSGANEVVVHIRAVRNPFAAYPAKKTQEATAVLKQLYPKVFPVSDILDVALSNTNPCVHPMPTLLSAGRIEYCGGDFWLYREGMTPSVWRAMRALDQERVAIRKALGFPPPHSELPEEVGQVFVDQFGYNGILAGRQMKGPKELTDRYLTEDVPMGLVFYSSVGRLAGVATPVVDSVITLVSAVLGKDMWAEGRTVAGLGLGGLKSAEVLAQLA